MSNIEERRSLLEDLEVIESSITKRFQRNPELYYKYQEGLKKVVDPDIDLPSKTVRNTNKIYKTRKHKRKRKQILLQQYEINEFLDDYRRKEKQLMKQKLDISEFRDKGADFVKFEELLESINNEYNNQNEETPTNLKLLDKKDKYAMFSSSININSPNNILSKRSQLLDLNNYFSKEEQYGEILNLEQFYSSWLNVVKTADCSILKYILMLNVFLDKDEFILNSPMDRKNLRYVDFIRILSKYFESYLEKRYILNNWINFKTELKKSFEKYSIKPIVKEKKGYLCISCGKWFKNSNVYDGHLKGKQHEKHYSNRKMFLYNEYKLHRIINYLKYEFDESKAYMERKLAFTNTERNNELKLLTKKYEEPAYNKDEPENTDKYEEDDNSMSNAAEDRNKSFNMPLGPDGMPIPLWLYKLQGLDIKYNCEICGNKEYQGRKAYENHFSELTHTSHLYFLGIQYSKAFKGITSIAEAKSLWSSMHASNGSAASFSNQNNTKLAMTEDIEVEDSEGNVMSKKIYDELKKQNLV
ncbi:hypothetical protein TPHA_0A00910 [Tetrapisispora phaffii CBS 4417]|uniref:C2H2-type domain-containing protein n=1 Tax=Tetrapisispora phaffii (strain ATCC 24235 / CBS 4417 / NBRC 1672 / NRRL Y-8282 / UCD 70-5) TaxID=1071381 RepID=G8BMP8_TETPH|nr:hypothetical protein TPHA_0A00910 [Tetrapisispora phaffii CBS 4417]CCE61176.1 hypothetical protein TPHA_0A00910 [Tetrapisispora phaffii CBS 4417]